MTQLFHGQHSFALTADNDGTTRLTIREQFSCVLAMLARPLLRASQRNGSTDFNAALKSRVERQHRGAPRG